MAQKQCLIKKTIYIMHAKYIQTTEISVYTSSANVTLEIKDDGCHSFIKLSFHFPFLNQHKKNINFSLFRIETWAYFQGVIYLVIRALRTLFCSIFKTNSVLFAFIYIFGNENVIHYFQSEIINVKYNFFVHLPVKFPLFIGILSF